jgi:hypothetical protein
MPLLIILMGVIFCSRTWNTNVRIKNLTFSRSGNAIIIIYDNTIFREIKYDLKGYWIPHKVTFLQMNLILDTFYMIWIRAGIKRFH